MYTYSTYGLAIRSVIELPELRTHDADGPFDVSIEYGSVDPVPESAPQVGVERVTATPDSCRVTHESYGTIRVENGERVVLDRASQEHASSKSFRLLLENQILGVVLHQRGFLVLHASAVDVGGRAVVFLGRGGAGKSTTAAAFYAQGYPVLEDDVVGIRFDDGRPFVVPGVPELRLTAETLESLGVAPEAGSKSNSAGKLSVPIPRTDTTVPLAACYLLAEGQSLRTERVSGPERIFALLPHTFGGSLLADMDTVDRHFEHCSSLAEQVSIRRLTKPTDHTKLPALVEQVIEDTAVR